MASSGLGTDLSVMAMEKWWDGELRNPLGICALLLQIREQRKEMTLIGV